MQIKGIEFAPAFVPLVRRYETLAAFVWTYIILFGPITGWSVLLYVIIDTRYTWLGIAYLLWICIDRPVGCSTTLRYPFVRKLVTWTHLKNYFPVSLVKTHDLPADKSYIFATYPHGVFSYGALINFGTDANQFSELFPGLKTFIISLGFHFIMPFIREIAIGVGIKESSEKCLINILDGEKGNVAVLIVGGVSEAFKSYPGKYRIILKRRRGFVRVALKTGASLVPVFSFGETNLFGAYEAEPNSFWGKVMKSIKWKGDNVIPIGRGLFQYSFGIIPRRRPIVTVVGKPIDLPKIANPKDEDVDKYHQIFTTELNNLFEEHKTKYAKNPGEMELTDL
ncbi:Diacylglycerol acyltransferase [Cinara cedri]|uniref:Acyltransferase n=1 Tax=Cinara cedri TaxID=506608 RepID=A0A5E4MNK0_9HEMI|nr:Diacylglycerol acyltransferase [Cinara cedri]